VNRGWRVSESPATSHLLCALVVGAVTLTLPRAVFAEELFVGGPGDAHVTIGSAMAVAVDGDVITVRPGTYSELVESAAPGVTLRAEPGAGEVLITNSGRVLRLFHERFTIEGVVLDGQYGDRDAVQVRTGANHFTMRGVEVRRSGRDCIDMGNVTDILIEDSSIHHCLQSSAPVCSSPVCREDAHGITGGAVRRVTIRNTDIHSFSGDGVQFAPGRSDEGWGDLVIEGSRIWLERLPAAAGGYAAGIVPGENALDTKTSNDMVEPAEITIRDTQAWGFQDGLITNMSAFNLKENVRVHLDRVTVWDSEIAFRLRGMTSSRPRGAQVTIVNTVIHSVDKAIRYEDGIDVVTILQSTFGGDIRVPFDDQSAAGSIDGRNVLFLGAELPSELSGGSNLAVVGGAFEDAAGHDYHLIAGSPAVDMGEALDVVLTDRDGVTRPQGTSWDIGAYEFCPDDCGMPDAGVDAGSGTPRDGGREAGMPPADASRPTGDSGPASSPDGGCSCALYGKSPQKRLVGFVFVALLMTWRRTRR